MSILSADDWERRHKQLVAAQTEWDDLQASFDLRWKADMRAIKMWQEAHPGNDLVWPDHADLCVWLLEQLAELQTAISELQTVISMLEART
jgi:hypothetical protein